jgi:hypothetical protein
MMALQRAALHGNNTVTYLTATTSSDGLASHLVSYLVPSPPNSLYHPLSRDNSQVQQQQQEQARAVTAAAGGSTLSLIQPQQQYQQYQQHPSIAGGFLNMGDAAVQIETNMNSMSQVRIRGRE